MRPEDATRAVDLGCAGIIVSNHGGRQLDQMQSAIAALPAVVDAVGDRAEVYLDGGVRRGSDMLKAVALGARACLAGRALVYGLGAAGEAGVERAMSILAEELRVAMALSGCTSLGQLDRSWVRPPSSRVSGSLAAVQQGSGERAVVLLDLGERLEVAEQLVEHRDLEHAPDRGLGSPPATPASPSSEPGHER